MHNIVIFGGPGSGKGTQSERLVNRYGLHHISTGEVLRKQIALGTPNGKIADSYISKGNLIPDDLMLSILADELDSEAAQGAPGVIFDGFPRNIAQAEALAELLKKRGATVDSVIGLEVPDNILADRLVERGKVSHRSDDTPETIAKRLKVYHNTTSPLREYYTNSGTYIPVDGSRTIDEIFDEIASTLDPKISSKVESDII